MKRPLLKNLLTAGILAGLGISLLTGCEKEKDMDYTINGVTQDGETKTGEGKSNVEQFRDVATWEENWKSSTGADVKVDAKIAVPDVEYMSVVEAVEPEFDMEYKEKMAKKLFDNEDIYYGDERHLTKKDMEERDAFLEAGGTISNFRALKASGMLYDDLTFPEDEQWQQDDGENAGDGTPADQYNRSLRSYTQMDRITADQYNGTLGNSYTPVEEYMPHKYIGTYEGRYYKLSFVEDDEYIRRIKEIRFELKDLKDAVPDELAEIRWPVCAPWTQSDIIDNLADISEEEALEKARGFMENLGMDYLVFAYACPLIWGDATGIISEESMVNWSADGYVFNFDIGTDDIPFVEYGIESDYSNYGMVTNEKEREEHIIYSMETRMQIFVTDEGVIRMSAYNPLEIESVSERVEMLSLDTVKKIIKEQLETHYDDFNFFPRTSSTRFDKMELIYFRVDDEKNPGHYSYIPTWRLSDLTESKEMHIIWVHNPVLINAIDGSVIDMPWEEY